MARKKRDNHEETEQMVVLVPIKLKKAFQKHCDDNGHNLSSRVRFLMKTDCDFKK